MALYNLEAGKRFHFGVNFAEKCFSQKNCLENGNISNSNSLYQKDKKKCQNKEKEKENEKSHRLNPISEFKRGKNIFAYFLVSDVFLIFSFPIQA
jgi:hypothetical protein